MNLTGRFVVNCLESAAGDLIGKLNAAVPADVTGATGEIDEHFPGPASGEVQIAAELSATVNQGDVGSLVTAVETALQADNAVLVSLELKVA